MNFEERINEVECWWGGADVGVNEEGQVYEAFCKVLTRPSLSDEEFEIFMDSDVVVMQSAMLSFSTRFVVPAKPGDQREVNMVVLSPYPRGRLVDAVAHEVAHIVLGHQRLGGLPPEARPKIEAEADGLAVKWGFK